MKAIDHGVLGRVPEVLRHRGRKRSTSAAARVARSGLTTKLGPPLRSNEEIDHRMAPLENVWSTNSSSFMPLCSAARRSVSPSRSLPACSA
jgi:hypothetical protein